MADWARRDVLQVHDLVLVPVLPTDAREEGLRVHRLAPV